jgi:hypothetical protein
MKITMKSLALAVITILFTTSIVMAHHDSPQHERRENRVQKTEERKEYVENKIQERQKVLSEKINAGVEMREQRRAMLGEKAQERVRNLVGNISTKLLKL